MSVDSFTASALDSLGVVADAIGARGRDARAGRAPSRPLARRRAADPRLRQEYTSAQGSYLYDADGRAYLDFHTGEGFASLGHNHPDVREVLQATLAADLVDGVQLHYSALAGMLAEALCGAPAARARRRLLREHRRRGGGLGDEVRARGDRAAAPDLLRRAAFTGSRSGPLSLVGDEFFKEGFGPLLPGCERVPFGDLDAPRGGAARRTTSPPSSSSRSRAAW